VARRFPFVQSVFYSGSSWLQRDVFGLTPPVRPGHAMLISLPRSRPGPEPGSDPDGELGACLSRDARAAAPLPLQSLPCHGRLAAPRLDRAGSRPAAPRRTKSCADVTSGSGTRLNAADAVLENENLLHLILRACIPCWVPLSSYAESV
jgi:hypothetical protein